MRRRGADWVTRSNEPYIGVDQRKFTRLDILLEKLKNGSITQEERDECLAFCRVLLDSLPDIEDIF